MHERSQFPSHRRSTVRQKAERNLNSLELIGNFGQNPSNLNQGRHGRILVGKTATVEAILHSRYIGPYVPFVPYECNTCSASPHYAASSVHSWPEPRGSTNNCTTWHFNNNAKSIVSVQYCQFANVFAASFYFAKSRQDLGHGSFASGVATLRIYRILELQMASNKEV